MITQLKQLFGSIDTIKFIEDVCGFPLININSDYAQAQAGISLYGGQLLTCSFAFLQGIR